MALAYSSLHFRLASSTMAELPITCRPAVSTSQPLAAVSRHSPFHLCSRRYRPLQRSAVPTLVRAEKQSGDNVSTDSFTQLKHVLLPITDRNPFLSEATRQAAATTTALAKKFGADITVVVIDEKEKETIPEYETQLSNIRWHLCEGGFQEFGLLERLGEGKKTTAIIGEVADDLNLDLVVLSMEAIHSKHVDGNLLAEFIPCPVLLLPL